MSLPGWCSRGWCSMRWQEIQRRRVVGGASVVDFTQSFESQFIHQHSGRSNDSEDATRDYWALAG
ncbi:hypothetical protein CY34DRAFT_798920 [Suillus luteus UH-Slu-Lm8-n1]|uniref:Uncharacterized protein n=1 Tax=Suillus luteus UH-Slu-Lm8-n1 TaxID=930992 RepID=A0A0D0BQ73_9AGAM|nr:hypothetical protein CY34DRAFT_798920 [Suillus luteus UH-Slu-Lm8-n1]